MAYKTLEELEPIFTESGYTLFGHGTGRSGNSEEVVDSIFAKGLRTKDNSLYFTTVVLASPTPEIKAKYRELDLEEPTLDSLEENFQNWPHLDSKRIIIMRLPNRYINMYANRADLDGERYGAFMNELDGRYYLDPKFIVGSYDTERRMVRMNERFKEKLDEEDLEELDRKYKATLEKRESRLAMDSLFSNVLREDSPSEYERYK